MFPGVGTTNESAETGKLQLSEGEKKGAGRLYDVVERRFGEDKAKEWIKKTLLSLAQIELVVVEGERVEHEWREKHRI